MPGVMIQTIEAIISMRATLNTTFALATILLVAACGPSEADSTPAGTASAGPIPAGATMPADHPPIGQLPQNHPDVSTAPGTAPAPQAGGATAAAGETRTGTVKETMRSGGYSYALLEMEDGEIWAAGPETEIAEGDVVTISGMMGLSNFYARSLDRTFEQILFVSGFTKS